MSSDLRRIYVEFLKFHPREREGFVRELMGSRDPDRRHAGEVLEIVWGVVRGRLKRPVLRVHQALRELSGDPVSSALLYYALGLHYSAAGNLHSALYANLKFLEAAREAGWMPGVLKALSNIVGVHFMMEDPAGAQPYLAQLVDILEDSQEVEGAFGALVMLAYSTVYGEDHLRLRDIIERLESLAKHPHHWVAINELRGTLKLLEGDIQGALNHFWEGTVLGGEFPHPNLYSCALFYADTALFAGRLGDEIKAIMSVVRPALEESGRHRFRRAYYISLEADALALEGQLGEALRKSRQAAELFREAHEHLLAYSAYMKALVFAWHLRDPSFFQILSEVAPRAHIYNKMYTRIPILGDFIRRVLELDRYAATVEKKPQLRIRLLGDFAMETPEGAYGAKDWKNKKALLLFWHLLLVPDSYMSYEEISFLLWPDEDPKRTYPRIRVTVSYIRKMMGGSAKHLETKRSLGYRIKRGPCMWVDLWELEDMVHRIPLIRNQPSGEFDRVRAKLEALYGPLLPGVESPVISTRRSYLEERVRSVLERE